MIVDQRDSVLFRSCDRLQHQVAQNGLLTWFIAGRFSDDKTVRPLLAFGDFFRREFKNQLVERSPGKAGAMFGSQIIPFVSLNLVRSYADASFIATAKLILRRRVSF